MIKICFFKNKQKICGFQINNHGKDIVCSAVSALALNTCNCIENFTNIKFRVDYNENGGFLKFLLADFNFDTNDSNYNDAILILKCLHFGIKSIKKNYPKEINIKYKEV